ncbi:MAG: endo-1,4-beta-xylanase [Blautia sp.]|nr:endo-1,4-beta-xylanase [Blautia sp.]
MDKYAHRKANAAIHLQDSQGRPLAGEKVSLKLVRHAFLFGCGGFDSLPLTADDIESGRKAFYAERMDKWTKLFNYGTLPFYWGRYEPVEGKPNENGLRKAARYLTEHGAKVKGHPLCWHTVCADWLMEYDNKTILDKQLARIDRDVRAFRGLIDIWDVINEVVIMPIYDRYDNAVTRICRDLGRVGLVKEVFQAAAAANPDALLLINDFDLSEKYRILIDGCLAAGVPIGAIGIQTHQHQGYKGKAWLEDILERYSVFGLPLHFTENTLVSGHLMPGDIVDLNDYQVEDWPSTPEGEERQMREWKEMLEILFAHPLVEAVTGWDFADGAWLNAPSGLIRKDNTEKPSYRELCRLIHEEWTTNVTTAADEEGNVTLEGFRGLYELECRGKKEHFELKKEMEPLTVSVPV